VFSNLLPGNDSFVAIRCNGNVISDPLLSNGRLLLLHHSDSQPYCHNIVDNTLKMNDTQIERINLLLLLIKGIRNEDSDRTHNPCSNTRAFALTAVATVGTDKGTEQIS
jgi:hypothetical protein